MTKGVERWGSPAVRKGKYLGSALAVDGTEPEASKKYFQRGMHAAALRLLGSFCGRLLRHGCPEVGVLRRRDAFFCKNISFRVDETSTVKK